MHKERPAARLEAGIETYRSNEFDIGSQFIGVPPLDHAPKAPQFPGFGAPIEGFAIDFNVSNDIDYWHPQRGHSLYDESKNHGILDVSSVKQPQRSHTWPPWDHPDSTYGSQLGRGATPSVSDSICLDSRTDISCALDDYLSYTNGAIVSRQPRTKSIEDNKLRCDKCHWVGKTPSEKRKHDARHRKDHKCGEDGCEARFGTRNDLERHRKSVHSKCPQCGPKETYKCFGRNCGHPDKVWPRLDNFKAHLRLKHSEQNEEHLLSQSRMWYKKRKMEEEEKGTKLSNMDMTPIRETPTTLTISPPKTLLNPSTHVPGDYYEDRLEKLTLNPIGNPRSLNMLPEHLQSLNELPYSSLKADNPLALNGDLKLPSLPDIFADLDSPRIDEIVLRKSENYPTKGTLPGVESFDHVVPATNVQDLAVKLQDGSELSNEERKICLMALTWKTERTRYTPKSEEGLSAKTCVEATEKFKEIAKEGPKQEDLECPVCHKFFDRSSTLKKHLKRHEKPYGCTFAGCYGQFGSKADWKRHESMQHCLTQSFRCSLPRGNHPQCAKLFFQQNDFVDHLKMFHHDHAAPDKIKIQVAISYIGSNDADSKFSYWCGFCKEIKTVEKTGISASNERFDHIDSEHFQKNDNIKKWIPAKGHTEKGAQKKRDKSRMKKHKRSITDHQEENSELLYDNGCGDPELSAYHQCPSSEDETDTEFKPQSSRNCEDNKSLRKVSEHPAKDFILTVCCQCGDGPQNSMNGRCIAFNCQHEFCSQCPHLKEQQEDCS